MSWEDYLAKIYYDPVNAGSFSGPEKLYRYVRKAGKYVLRKYKIRKWLQRQEAYSLQRGVRRRFKRNILQEGRHPSRLRSDKGQEFRSKAFNALLKEQTIEHLYTQNTESKANYAERAIKTMKVKL